MLCEEASLKKVRKLRHRNERNQRHNNKTKHLVLLKKEKERYVKKFGHDNPIKYAVVVSSMNNFKARLLQFTLHEKEMVAAKSQLIQGPQIKLKNYS